MAGSKVSIVVPCYRSELTLATLVTQMLAELSPKNCPEVGELEILLVVDGSPDGTGEIARNLQAAHPAVRAIELRRNYGQHNATLAGIRQASGSIVVTCDDDLQHRPADIPVMLRALTKDVDLVYGVSAQEEHGALRSLASRTVKRSLASAGVPNASSISALRAFRTELREGFDHTNDPFVSIDVMLSWTTTRVVAVTVNMEERTQGKSNYRLSSLMQHAMNLVTGYSTLPLRMVTWLGFIVALFGVGLGVYVIVMFIEGHTTVAGFTTLACLISIFASAQLISLGVIGEYVGRIHVREMQRPQYVIRHIDSDPRDDGDQHPPH